MDKKAVAIITARGGSKRIPRKNIKEFLGVTAKVSLKSPRTIARSEGKASRVIDNRPKE